MFDMDLCVREREKDETDSRSKDETRRIMAVTLLKAYTYELVLGCVSRIDQKEKDNRKKRELEI